MQFVLRHPLCERAPRGERIPLEKSVSEIENENIALRPIEVEPVLVESISNVGKGTIWPRIWVAQEVVGEFAIFRALEAGTKCFYTTPIKALSNQKFAELVARYGEKNIGLLTGDNSINGEAPIVVMTTEVLRNMLYAGSQTLSNLAYVIMDEVHYLADRSRGAVWEEVIIHLPQHVQLVCQSATSPMIGCG